MAETMKTILQIRRDTTENWELNKDTIPAEGEPCLDLDTGVVKYGDGVTTYEKLKPSGTHSSHYEGVKQSGENDNDVIDRVLAAENITAGKDDIFVVKTLIASGKYSYTAFVYNGTAWAAMDGNYSAKNVYFDTDMVVTQTFGKYTISSSTPNRTIESTGMNLYDLIMDAYSEKKNPSKSDPKVSAFSVTGNGASDNTFEVGTTVTPQWTSTFNAGSYTYKSSASNTEINAVSGTGVQATAWKIKQGDATIGTIEDGTANASFVIGDGNNTDISGVVNYSVTADYSDGNYALTNLNTLPDNEVRIIAGTTPAATDTLIFTRKMFGGGTSEPVVNSSVLRSKNSATASVIGNSAPFEFKAVSGDTKVVFAYPKALTTKVPKFEIFTMAWGETSGFISSEVEVADARGTNEDGSLNNAMTYTVWTYTPAGSFTAAETKYRVYFN